MTITCEIPDEIIESEPFYLDTKTFYLKLDDYVILNSL